MTVAEPGANATFCATLVDQFVADGLTAAFVAPGSRSTPLVVAMAGDPRVDLELFHDERSAAFAALGHGLATGRPAALACTSGTAAAHFFATVIEADLSAVPLIVLTADRPPELWGRGAPQTIDQTRLYGDRVRLFVEPGPPSHQEQTTWRPLARSLWAAATGPMPGPVHANLSFREPLLSEVHPLPVGIEPATAGTAEPVAPLRLGAGSGAIVAGRGPTDPCQILELAERLGWPVIADHRSGCRRPGHRSVINRFDSLLRASEFAQAHIPNTIVRFGEIVSSKAVSQWITAAAAAGCQIISGRPDGRLIDPESVADTLVDEPGLVQALLADPDKPGDPDWLDGWRTADDQAEAAIAANVQPESEIGIARAVVKAVPAGGALVVASSMPVRDVEWFGPPRDDIAVHSNRGANGIDGTIAAATGVALTGTATICLIGDVALLHDSTSLVGLADRDIDLTIVVIDNDGGGIFSFLPQHDELDTATYELLFGTPHGSDIAGLARANRLQVAEWPASLTPDGVGLVLAHSDREANRAEHERLNRITAEAVR